MGIAVALALTFISGSWGVIAWAFSRDNEATGVWKGQQVVMVGERFTSPFYVCCRYCGPFVMGERLGDSDGPWEA